MINRDLMEELNRLGTGIDIDKLESIVIDLNQAIKLSGIKKYNHSLTKMTKILKEVKASSIAFNKKTDSILEKDKYDKLLEKYGNEYPNTIYDIETNIYKDLIKNRYVDDRYIDVCATQNIEGIDVKCTYINGLLYKIHAISEYDKVIDLTSVLSTKLPRCIEILKDNELVELRGRVSIKSASNVNSKYLSTLCSTMHCLRVKTNIEYIDIIFNNIFFDTDRHGINSQWEKLEFIEKLGLNVCNRCLIRNTDKLSMLSSKNILYSINDYFKSQNCEYSTVGFNIKDNSDIDSNKYMFTFDVYNISDTILFESKITGIVLKNNKIYLYILPVECNDELLIDSIEVADIYDMEKYNTKIGNTVRFIVVDGKAILSK